MAEYFFRAQYIANEVSGLKLKIKDNNYQKWKT